ncbi:DMT family transporter [Promicromonospora thailandica]|uniref:Drug/metabolite transporter, DME family n=1 Tax=Promicromonospora thailandica TaxID=765201 RepID=A0A9X2JV80_9MICO|nr:DMT family transporter [Promicromonospora thailandica]MCP2265320.1 drug/metabolite transporter, DME family [Promicromonospora thailandica]BFF16850.1 EamA family transporter [Promicromonospora thailandica]
MSSTRTGLLLVCLAGVLWGTGGLALEILRDHSPLSVLMVSAYRMLVAALALLVASVVLRRGPRLLALVRAYPGRSVAVGLGTAAYQALYFGSVTTAGVTVATVVSLGLAPVLLAVVDLVRARHRTVTRGTLRLALVLGAALSGLVLVSAASGSGAAVGTRPVVGLLLAVACGCVYAATTALGSTVLTSADADPLALTTVATTAGAVGLVPVALVGGGPFVTSDPVALGTLGYLGLFTMALAYGLFYTGLRTTRSGAAVVATLLEPVTAAVAAAVVLGERLGLAGVIGSVLILTAVAGLDEPGA